MTGAWSLTPPLDLCHSGLVLSSERVHQNPIHPKTLWEKWCGWESYRLLVDRVTWSAGRSWCWMGWSGHRPRLERLTRQFECCDGRAFWKLKLEMVAYYITSGKIFLECDAEL
jgi:hypothetical protein